MKNGVAYIYKKINKRVILLQNHNGCKNSGTRRMLRSVSFKQNFLVVQVVTIGSYFCAKGTPLLNIQKRLILPCNLILKLKMVKIFSWNIRSL